MDNKSLLEEMLRDVENAPEPGEIAKNKTVFEGDEDTPPMIAKLKSAGYVYVYDTRTGDRSLCNKNMLPFQLKKKREDGSFAFTTTKPKVEVARGTFKCMLHPSNPNRAHYDELGLPICRKANLTSIYQVNRHMQKRHKTEWETLEAERVIREKEEEREFQRGLLGIVSKKKEVETKQEAGFTCPECKRVFGTALALSGHSRSHKK